MNRKTTFIVLLVLLCSSFTRGQNYQFNKISPELWDEISYTTKSDDTFRVTIIMNDQFDALASSRQIQNLNKAQQREFVVNELQRISQNAQKGLLGELQQGEKASLVSNIQTFWIINGISCTITKDLLLAIAKRPEVGLVTKDVEISIADEEKGNGPSFRVEGNQWNVTKTNADEVWNQGYTGKGVIVAVIDSGVNYNHTDISGNMWDGGQEYPHHGWDFTNNDNDPMDDRGHGTHCAGTVSSKGANGKQCGIAKDAKIMALKVFDAKGSGPKSHTWAAIQFAVSHGADVLSLSLGSIGVGGEWGDRIVMENVLHCGVVAATAAGNVGNEYNEGQLKYPVPFNIISPGCCPSPWTHPDQTLQGGHSAVITIGATTSDDERWSLSSFGPSTWTQGNSIGPYNDYPWTEGNASAIGLIKPDIVAPGHEITSLSHSSNTGYLTTSGTSMATPCAAGVMALMLEADPTLTPLAIDSILETTAVSIEGQNSKNNYVGSGRIDALAAINFMKNNCPAPTDLTANSSHALTNLSWTAANGISAYNIYRNGNLIAEAVTGTVYADANVPAGENVYFVKSKGDDGKTSLPSNQVTVTITTNEDIPVPNTLDVTATESETVTLRWGEPSKRQSTLNYANTGYAFMNMGGSEYTAAQRFPSSMLRPYAGMQIERFSFKVKTKDTSCSIALYEGNALEPGTAIYQASIVTTEDEQLVTHTLESPVAINPNKELWVAVTTTSDLFISSYESNLGGDAMHYKFASNVYWDSFPQYAWTFQLYLNDNDYTYNVYHNGNVASSTINNAEYTTTLEQGLNIFRITSFTHDYESPMSEAAMVYEGTGSLAITMAPSDKLIITSGSALTLTETLSIDNPANLILEDGAQLIHPNHPVKGTLKKGILPITSGENDGWYTIASPVDEHSLNTATTGTYDFYTYDEKSAYWLNQKDANNNITQFVEGQGVLYANAAQQTLEFSGDMKATNATITIPMSYSSSDENLKGFNLVGNPFTRNLVAGDIRLNDTPITTYYVADGGNNLIAYNISERPIQPGEGFFIQAQATGNLVFNPSNSKRDIPAPHAFLSINVSNGNSADRAYIQFGQGNALRKMSLPENTSHISLWHDNAAYAAVTINEDEKEMPIHFKTDDYGRYTITVTPTNLDFSYLHLVDNLTGTDINLLKQPSYTFDAGTKDFESRFKLLFDSKEIAEGTKPFASYVDGHIIVTGIDEPYVLQLIDMTGRIVEKPVPGVYVLRLITENDTMTQKIIIK